MKLLFYLLVSVVCFSCTPDEMNIKTPPLELMEIPNGFSEIAFPEDNPYTKEKWELGKKLFFDPIMSVDSTISCASCHNPDLAFSDELAFSSGVDQRLGERNSPTLANVAFHPYLTREGGVPTLEMQVLVPIQEHSEFDFNIVLIAERLSKDSSYIEMSLAAYNRMPDAFVISRALATYERSLISGYSRFDQFVNYEKLDILSIDELNGRELFFSEKTNCSVCHNGFNFTNYAFENNGLYIEYNDVGRFRLTGNEEDVARFKVPTLRNVELTSPYMHDGSILKLDDVVAHYNTGGKNHPHKSELIKPLDLSDREMKDLVAFLKSLTDYTFVENPIFKSNP